MNKVILVTGGSIGIGRATVLAFAQEGCRLVFTFHMHRQEAQEVAARCTALGAADVLFHHLDVRDPSSIAALADTVRSRFQKIDWLINNAGVVVRKLLDGQTEDEIQNQLRTNLEGLILMTRAFLPLIREGIINLGSGVGKTAYPHLAPYGATKWGVRGFSMALAKAYPHLRMYTVNPDATATQMSDFKGRPPENVARIIVAAVKGAYDIPSGGDVDVWELDR